MLYLCYNSTISIPYPYFNIFGKRGKINERVAKGVNYLTETKIIFWRKDSVIGELF
jgi:hypothetical protein